MNFDDYPLDSHICQFQVGSCEYDEDQAGHEGHGAEREANAINAFICVTAV